VKAHHIL
jgi:NAD(P)-dependent dehydrogenase (short-subunit alcohol dehydrogenase family)